MRTSRWLALGTLVGALVLLLGVTDAARSQKPTPEKDKAKPKEPPAPRYTDSIAGRLAAKAGVAEADATKLLGALGPVIRDELGRGQTVNVPGLGTFRVVRIPEHKDLQNGRPVTVPATNYVEFLPTGGMIDAANAPGAKPAETVPPFQYITLPGQTPGQKVPSGRVPSTRSK